MFLKIYNNKHYEKERKADGDCVINKLVGDFQFSCVHFMLYYLGSHADPLITLSGLEQSKPSQVCEINSGKLDKVFKNFVRPEIFLILQ